MFIINLAYEYKANFLTTPHLLFWVCHIVNNYYQLFGFSTITKRLQYFQLQQSILLHNARYITMVCSIEISKVYYTEFEAEILLH